MKHYSFGLVIIILVLVLCYTDVVAYFGNQNFFVRWVHAGPNLQVLVHRAIAPIKQNLFHKLYSYELGAQFRHTVVICFKTSVKLLPVSTDQVELTLRDHVTDKIEYNLKMVKINSDYRRYFKYLKVIKN